jgi:nucleotide-binding universal stress UspA family protein
MFDSLGFLVLLAVVWFAIGVTLAVTMGRRGHNGFGWFVLGSVLGPLAAVLALDARRHGEELEHGPLRVGAPGTAGPGPVDVLVGCDFSSESVAALDTVVDLLSTRIGRLTVATVLPYGSAKEQLRKATDGLCQLARRHPERVPELEILHGHPSTALGRFAAEGRYQLIAVGTRGAGISKAILGSAASELARDSKVPILVVGGRPTDVGHPATFAAVAAS